MPDYDFSAVDELLTSADAAARGGMVLHIRRGGVLLYERAFHGFALDERLPLASATKWLSAALLLRLCSDPAFGLGLDDYVQQHLPDWGNADPAKAAITLRMLLCHSSGLPGNVAAVSAQNQSLQDCAVAMGELPLSYAPGTNFLYGECGLQVAGALAEQVSGRALPELFLEELCLPLGLQSLSYVNAQDFVERNPQLGAGLFGTAAEYCLLLAALQGSLIPGHAEPFILPQLAREMFRDQTSAVALPFAYTPYIYIKALARMRYGLGCWREQVDGASGELIRAGSQGRSGASPWINLRRGDCGMLLVHDVYLHVTPLYLKLHTLLDEILGPQHA